MSKVIELEVRVGVTMNLGNYESARLDYSVREQFNDSPKVDIVLDDMRKELTNLVKKDIAKIGREIKK